MNSNILNSYDSEKKKKKKDTISILSQFWDRDAPHLNYARAVLLAGRDDIPLSRLNALWHKTLLIENANV